MLPPLVSGSVQSFSYATEETNLEDYINNKPLLIFLKLPITRFENSLENSLLEWSKKYEKITVIMDRHKTNDHNVLKQLFNSIEKLRTLQEALVFVEEPTFALIDRLAQNNLKISLISDSIRVLEYKRNLPVQSDASSVNQCMHVRIHLYACSVKAINQNLTSETSLTALDSYLIDFATRIQQPFCVENTWTREAKFATSNTVVIADTESNSSKQATPNNSGNDSKPGEKQIKPIIHHSSQEDSAKTIQSDPLANPIPTLPEKRKVKFVDLFPRKDTSQSNSNNQPKQETTTNVLEKPNEPHISDSSIQAIQKNSNDSTQPVLEKPKERHISDISIQAVQKYSNDSTQPVLEKPKERNISDISIQAIQKNSNNSTQPVLEKPKERDISDIIKQAVKKNSHDPTKPVLESNPAVVANINREIKTEFSASTKEAIKRNRFKYDLSKGWVTDNAARFEEIGLNLTQYLSKSNAKSLTQKIIKDWLSIGDGFKFFNNFWDFDSFIDFMSDNGLSIEFTKDEFTDFLTDLFFKGTSSNKMTMKPHIKRLLQQYALLYTENLFLIYLQKNKNIKIEMQTIFEESHVYDYFNFLAARVILDSTDYTSILENYIWGTEDFFTSVMCRVLNCTLNGDRIGFRIIPEWTNYVESIGGEKFIPKINFTKVTVERR